MVMPMGSGIRLLAILASGIGNFLLIADGEQGAEVYSAATMREFGFGYAPEGRQVASEHRPLIHPAQFVGHAARRLQQFQEQSAVSGIAPETAVESERGCPASGTGSGSRAWRSTRRARA